MKKKPMAKAYCASLKYAAGCTTGYCKTTYIYLAGPLVDIQARQARKEKRFD